MKSNLGRNSCCDISNPPKGDVGNKGLGGVIGLIGTTGPTGAVGP
jgi:hypothetical protein